MTFLNKTVVFCTALILPLVIGVQSAQYDVQAHSHDWIDSSEDKTISGSYDSSGQRLKLQTERDNPDNIKFYLFPNPMQPDEKIEMMFGDKTSLNPTQSQFQRNVVTKVLVHGYTQNLEHEFPQNVKNAYLKRMRRTGEKFNIVVVDWGKLAYQSEDGLSLYTRAVRNVEPTGVRIADFISSLIDNGLINGLEQIHLIGHSLGAHVVGQCGHSLYERNGTRVNRITGLDPAGPLFYLDITGRRLDTWDGDFVDVYHCNPGGYGIDESVGDIEFYPNPEPVGRIQPQCLKLRQTLQSPDSCSHNYCPKFFALALNKKIVGQKCVNKSFFFLQHFSLGCSESTAVYGEDLLSLDASNSKPERGKYFVNIPDNLDDMNLFLK